MSNLVDAFSRVRPLLIAAWAVLVFLATKLGAQVLWPDDRFAIKEEVTAEINELRGDIRLVGKILCNYIGGEQPVSAGDRYMAGECSQITRPAASDNTRFFP